MNLKKIRNQLSRVDIFSPLIFFPLVLLVYNLAGIIFDFGRSKIFDLKENTYLILIVALVVYFIVGILVRKYKVSLHSLSFPKMRKLYLLGLLALMVVGLCSLVYIFYSGQIGLEDESVRRSLDPKLTFFAAFFWFGYLIFISKWISSRNYSATKSILIYLVSSLIVASPYLLLGYRTNIFIIFFSLIVFIHYQIKQIKFKYVLLLVMIVSILFSAFGYMRVLNEDKTDSFNNQPVVEVDKETTKEIQKINQVPSWAKVITAEFVNGKIVLSRIAEYTNENGSLNGHLHLSAFETVLPGENKSPRTIVTEKVNSLSDNGILVTREGRTTTPGLLGQFYLDGGYFGVIIGIALISMLLGIIYNSIKERLNDGVRMSYAIILTLFAIAVHTGLLDVIFFVVILGAIFYGLLVNNKKFI